MARLELKPAEGQRHAFHATIGRKGRSHGKVTLLLKDVAFADGRFATDHVWFRVGKTWEALDLRVGDRITFEARVKPYTKGYKGARAERLGQAWSEDDLKLSHPTKAAILERSTGPELRVEKRRPKKRRPKPSEQGSKPIAKTRGTQRSQHTRKKPQNIRKP